jgi:hypothetical protein
MARIKPSDFADVRHYGIRHGSEEAAQHALALHHGLALLGPDFACVLCWRCKGTGVRDYTGCETCSGTGLLQGHPNIRLMPAFDSQRHQVLVAATRSLLLPFEVCVC